MGPDLRHFLPAQLCVACIACAPAQDSTTGGAAEAAPDAGPGGEADDADTTKPVERAAYLHLHMFSEHAFGGAWLHGTHDEDACRCGRGPATAARTMPDCAATSAPS